MRARVLLLALSLSLSGCFSTLGHLSGDRCVYHGTRMSWVWATEPSLSGGWPFLIDTPFSAVLDTVLLPYDLTAFLPEDMGGDHEPCEIRPLRIM